MGAVYPTGFIGGETFTFEVDGTPVAVAFDAGDQTLTQVINRINAACALLGFATPIAQPAAGQLRLKSPTLGSGSSIKITGGTARAALGMPAIGTTVTGANATPGTSPIELARPADPNGASAAAGIPALFLATVKTTSVTIENRSNNQTKVRWAIVGDLTQDSAC